MDSIYFTFFKYVDICITPGKPFRVLTIYNLFLLRTYNFMKINYGIVLVNKLFCQGIHYTCMVLVI